ncbi:MAG: hypothetical protein IIC78_05940 [Chloroflexi bacterium]|nr:hypothetical protein [Chloroflexota bacterium]
MAKVRHGDRFQLLIYRRVVGRQRLPSFLLALICIGLWYGVRSESLTWPSSASASVLLPAGLLSLAFWVFTLLAPRQAYAQARDDHLRLQTPIYRMKVAYSRIKNTRPVKMGKVFKPATLRLSQRRFLAPYIGHTALAVELDEKPRYFRFLRVFLHRFTFAPDSAGFIILVDDWIALSQQLSSRIDAWRMAHNVHLRGDVSDAASILQAPAGESKAKRRKLF